MFLLRDFIGLARWLQSVRQQQPVSRPGTEEDVMKTTAYALIALIASVSPSFAASGAATDNGGFLTPLFLVFGAAIIALQAVPALMLLGSMVKGLFSAEQTSEAR
jgi:hypothetical protein